MRWTPALVFPQCDRNLRGFCAELRRLDHKFRSEFHPVAAHIHPVKHFPGKSTHSAVSITDAGMKKQIQQRRQTGIANVLVVPRHRARFDLSGKTISHHHFAAFAPLRHKSRHFGEIIAIVGITHDDESAARRANSGLQRRAIPALRNWNHSCAMRLHNFDRAVRRTVVRNYHFAAQSSFLERFLRFLHANSNRIRFVQAGDHHRNVNRIAGDIRYQLGRQLRLKPCRTLGLHQFTS